MASHAGSTYPNHRSYHKQQPGRLVVRNLNFQATEKNMRNKFEQYGEITEVKFPLKSKGSKMGCAFVQFTCNEDALKAITGCNMQIFMGRIIAVDLAVPKAMFQVTPDNVEQDVKVKVEGEEENKVQVERSEEEVHTNKENMKKKKNNKKRKYEEMEVKEEEEIKEEDNMEAEGSTKDDKDILLVVDNSDHRPKLLPSSTDSNKTSTTTTTTIKKEKKDKLKQKQPHLKETRQDLAGFEHSATSKDVEEGKTLFISKLSLDVSPDAVQKVLERFGPVKYVLLVVDKLTEQPKGTAFAQFKSREAADACLAASKDVSRQEELTMDGRVLEVRRALGRASVHGGRKEGSDGAKVDMPKGKDKRNLYLSKEGFIRQGTQAATGVSTFDLELRRQRELVKQSLLANLQMFVSPTRLCVNNLPATYSDRQLKDLFRDHSSSKAKVTEARVMRYLGQLDEQGRLLSRGYGFVCFTEHADALAALRAVNNNPTVFTAHRRPIIEFSIENRSVLNVKARRLQRSKEMMKDGKQIDGEKKAVTSITGGGAAAHTRQEFAGFNAKRSDTRLNATVGGKRSKASYKIHRHLGPKIRHRSGLKPGGKSAGKNNATTKSKTKNQNKSKQKKK